MELRIARIRKRMTQEELARKTGICRNIISRAENGDISKLNVKQIKKIVEVLEVSAEKLFFS